MRSSWRVAVLMVGMMLAPGCSVAVGGVARSAPNAAGRSIGTKTVERVLVGKSALSRTVGQTLSIDPRYPLLFGARGISRR